MRIPRFFVTVPYLHSYDLSDIFYHKGRSMVKLTKIHQNSDLRLVDFLLLFSKKILICCFFQKKYS